MMVPGQVATYETIGRTIVERFNSFSPVLQSVAECISQNPNDVSILTLSVISKRHGITESNFLRFSKSIGLCGFA